jgi:hypothetical protein
MIGRYTFYEMGWQIALDVDSVKSFLLFFDIKDDCIYIDNQRNKKERILHIDTVSRKSLKEIIAIILDTLNQKDNSACAQNKKLAMKKGIPLIVAENKPAVVAPG